MTTHSTEPRHLAPKDIAKLVRKALARQFPATTFAVRSHRSSSSSSISISWQDGPVRSAVDEVTKAFQGARFDGMIDYAWTADHWLKPNGEMIVANDPGSLMTGGCNPPETNPRPCEKSELVFAGHLYVQPSRTLSNSFVEAAFAAFVAKWGYTDMTYCPRTRGPSDRRKWLDDRNMWATNAFEMELHATSADDNRVSETPLAA